MFGAIGPGGFVRQVEYLGLFGQTGQRRAQTVERAGMGQYQPWRVGKHVREALCEVCGVQRDIRTAGLEHGQYGHQHLRRTLQTQGNESIGTDAR